MVPNLRFIGLYDRSTLIRVRLCLTTPILILNKISTLNTTDNEILYQNRPSQTQVGFCQDAVGGYLDQSSQTKGPGPWAGNPGSRAMRLGYRPYSVLNLSLI